MRLPWNRPSFDLGQTVRQAVAEVVPEMAETVRAQVDVVLGGYVPAARKGWPFALDQPHQFWMTTSPRRRPTKVWAAESLRAWARNFDPLTSVIEYLKAEAASVPIEFVPRDPDGPSVARQIRTMNAFVDDTGPLGGDATRRVFEARIFDDVLTVGAYAVWYRVTKGGSPLACEAIDAATIKPRVDTSGWPDRDVPFEQWVIGVPVAQFSPGELRYDGLIPRTDSPYFDSFVERAVTRVVAGLNLDEWNLSWLTEGNVRKGDTICLPESWTPDQIGQFRDWWDASVASKAGRQSVQFLPAGSQRVSDHSRKDQDFAEYETQVIRRICSIFGVMPASIGYAGEQYKVTQGDQMAQSRRVGLGRLLQLRKEFYDDLAERLGCPGVECRNVEDDWERQKETVDTAVKACGGPVMTPDEARARFLGLGPMPKAPEAAGEPPEGDDDGPERVERAAGGHGHWVTINSRPVFIPDWPGLASAVFSWHSLNGGSSFSVREGNMAGKDVWSVAYSAQSVLCPVGEFDESIVVEFLVRNKALIQRPGHGVGTWDDGQGTVWIDVVRFVVDESEATAFGVEQNQIEMFHLGRFETKELGGTGK